MSDVASVSHKRLCASFGERAMYAWFSLRRRALCVRLWHACVCVLARSLRTYTSQLLLITTCSRLGYYTYLQYIVIVCRCVCRADCRAVPSRSVAAGPCGCGAGCCVFARDWTCIDATADVRVSNIQYASIKQKDKEHIAHTESQSTVPLISGQRVHIHMTTDSAYRW